MAHLGGGYKKTITYHWDWVDGDYDPNAPPEGWGTWVTVDRGNYKVRSEGACVETLGGCLAGGVITHTYEIHDLKQVWTEVGCCVKSESCSEKVTQADCEASADYRAWYGSKACSDESRCTKGCCQRTTSTCEDGVIWQQAVDGKCPGWYNNEDYYCSEGRECCEIGKTSCEDNTCVDLQTDPNNCGSCGNACGANAHCSGGACQCDDGYKNCDGDWSTGCAECCGSETKSCTTSGCPGTQTCSDGSWGSCVKDDPCCGVTCPDDQWCEEGECVPEASTVVLFAIGLLFLTGYVRLKRRKRK